MSTRPRAVIQDLGELRRRLAPHPKRALDAIVFGPAARSEADQWSDLDLVIVADTPRPFLDRYLGFTGLCDVWLSPTAPRPLTTSTRSPASTPLARRFPIWDLRHG